MKSNGKGYEAGVTALLTWQAKSVGYMSPGNRKMFYCASVPVSPDYPYFYRMAKYTMEKVAGMYYLNDVKETASGFKLETDGTFKFFFTYGALDRYGSGKWTLQDDHIVFQSRQWDGKDFALVGSEAVNENLVILKMVGGNPVLLRHVFFSLKNGADGTWQQADQSGAAAFPLQQVTAISLVFEFCPEKFTHFAIENPQHNYFEFRFEEWLMEVFFQNFQLKVSRYALSGKHPLMKGEKFVYEKA